MLNLGIGVATYNRCAILKNTIENVRQFTVLPFNFIVADDGSTDNTRTFLKEEGIPFISGENKSIAWNKNRILFHLKEVKKCDIIILLENDAFPVELGWERYWIDGVNLHGHMNVAGRWFADQFISGSGSPSDPVTCHAVTGQCSGFSREMLSYVGYLDPRFRGYDGEHYEHSLRAARLGYGGFIDKSFDHEVAVFYSIDGGIQVTDPGSSFRQGQVDLNRVLFDQIRFESVFRAPWIDDEQMAEFVAEQRTMGAGRTHFRS